MDINEPISIKDEQQSLRCDWMGPQLICPTIPIRFEKSRFNTADISIEVDHENTSMVTIKVEPGDDITDSTTVRTYETKCMRINIDKFKHNFVAETFLEAQNGTDVAMHEVFGPWEDDFDNKTPDILIKDPDDERIIRCCEIATTRFDASAETQFFNKISTYDLILKDRMHKTATTVVFTVIIVSDNLIYSNMHLSQKCINELSARYAIGEEVLDIARDRSLLVDKSEAETRRQASCALIKDVVEKIEVADGIIKSNMAITKEYLDLVLRPVDLSVVHEHFMTSLRETANEEETIPLLKDIIHKYSSPRHVREDRRISNFPLLLPKVTKRSTEVEYKHFVLWEERPEVSNIWNAAMNGKIENGDWVEEDLDGLLEQALSDHDAKSDKQKYHRVEVRSKLNGQDKDRLSLDGVWAKTHGAEEMIKEKREYKRKPLHWETNTNDIEQFLQTTNLFEYSVENSPSMNDFKDLCELARTISGNPSKIKSTVEDVDEIIRTKLFLWLDMISDVALELAISNKQHCRPGHMILKKLRCYDVYILILPTKSTEHMFFSLCFLDPEIPRSSFTKMFSDWKECGSGVLTPFKSVKPSKIDNLAHLPSALVNICAFWAHQMNLETISPLVIKQRPDVSSLILLNILVMMEDKAKTEEAITLNRYAYMEIFKEHGRGWKDPNPLKIFTKANPIPRSRLELFIIKQSSQAFSLMLAHPPRKAKLDTEGYEDELPPDDQWDGLLNCLTHHKIDTATACINLVYMGYFKNKDETSEGNTDFSILEKTVEEEIRLRDVDLNHAKGIVEPTYPRPKEFSRNMIMFGSEMLIKRLKKSEGVKWREKLETTILDQLSRQLTVFIATLKASANIDPNNPPRTSRLTSDFRSGRRKVIEAISENLDKILLNPIENLSHFLETLEKGANGVVADLFKKNQHAGLREIYVMDIYSRIVQLFVETCSRVICSKFDNETLTHHHNKIRLLEEHKIKANKRAKAESRNHVDYCNSSDKSRWNQNLSMSALIIPLVKILPTKFHGAIMRILNLWTNKQIKIPQRVINMMIKRIPLESDTYMTMMDEFGRGQGLFMQKMEPFVHITSGMMQGILHFTSSLLHLTFLGASQSLVLSHLSTLYPNNQFMMTQVCSSDDSASVLTCMGQNTTCEFIDIKQMAPYLYTSYMCYVIERLSTYFCMSPSVKSTIALRDYVEYNSEFLLWNTIAIPLIKFVSASFRIQETLTIIERMDTMYNNLSDLVANGLPYYYASICQIGQALAHYKAMGISTNPLFSEYCDLIHKFPDPALGFFPLDNQLCPGILGFKYSHWKCGTTQDILKDPSKALNLGEVSASSFIDTLEKRVGNLRRWETLMIRVSQGIDWREYVEEHPELLYRHPENKEECIVKLSVKAAQPGVSKSLTSGNSYIKGLNSTVYSINTHCYTRREVFLSSVGKKERSDSKVSLMQELYSLNELPRYKISSDKLRLMFPLLDVYMQAERVLSTLQDLELVDTPRLRQTKTLMIMQSQINLVPFKVLDIVRAKWFNHSLPASKSQINKYWLMIKGHLPWLEDTVKATLESSPFRSHTEMYNFLSSEGMKKRTMKKIGPPIYSQSFESQLSQSITKTQMTGKVLATRSKKHYKKHSDVYQTLVARLSLALSLPRKMNNEEACYEVLTDDEHLLYKDEIEIASMTRKGGQLAVIQAFARRDIREETLDEYIISTKAGIITTFPREQRRKDVGGIISWVGYGEIHMSIDKLNAMVYVYDNKVTKIIVNKLTELRRNFLAFQEHLHGMGISKAETTITSLGELVYTSHSIVAKGDGCPILTDPVLGKPNTRMSGYHLTFSPGFVSLRAKSCSRVINVVRVPINLYEIPMVEVKQSEKICHLAWSYYKSLSWGSIFPLLSLALKDKEIRSWVSNTLKCRLSFRGYPQCDPSIYGSTITEDDSYLDDFDDEYLQEHLAMMSELTESIQVNSIFPKMEKMCEEAAMTVEEDAIPKYLLESIVHFFDEEPTHKDITPALSKTRTSFYTHPFWDCLIDEVRKGGVDVWTQILSGTIPPGAEKTARNLMTILGIEERGMKVTLDEIANWDCAE